MRRTSLTRKPKQRNRRKSQPLDAFLDAKFWRAEVTRTRCVMCRAFPVAYDVAYQHPADLRVKEGHHIIAKRHLRAEGLSGHLWDVRNGMCLCRWHHARHESHAERVPRLLLPPAAVEFAGELHLEWLLDREYPGYPAKGPA